VADAVEADVVVFVVVVVVVGGAGLAALAGADADAVAVVVVCKLLVVDVVEPGVWVLLVDRAPALRGAVRVEADTDGDGDGDAGEAVRRPKLRGCVPVEVDLDPGPVTVVPDTGAPLIPVTLVAFVFLFLSSNSVLNSTRSPSLRFL